MGYLPSLCRASVFLPWNFYKKHEVSFQSIEGIKKEHTYITYDGDSKPLSTSIMIIFGEGDQIIGITECLQKHCNNFIWSDWGGHYSEEMEKDELEGRESFIR